MQKNDIIQFIIEDIGTDGQGIGKYNGMAVFCQSALPGEEIEAKLILLKKNYAVARLEKILTPSPMRVKPPCPYFSKCGGCTLQHLSYAAQLEYKQQRVKDCLSRIGKLDIPVAFTFPSRPEYRYRNKAAFPCKMQNGYASIGLYAPHSHNVIDIPDCRIQHADIAVAMSQLRVWIVKYNISLYDEHTGEGLLRHVVFRTSSREELMMILVINGDEIPKPKALLALFKLVLPQVRSIVLNHNTKPGNVILGERQTVLLGSGTFFETMQDLEFRIGPATFLQVNHTQAEALYNNLFKELSIRPGETVLDLFCGAGAITLPAAKRAQHVTGIEISEETVENARFNANLNNITNVSFHAGDATAMTQELFSSTAAKPDVIIVDPPRKGLDAALIQTMVKAAPSRIGYVSCDPATLARDLAIFVDAGYKVTSIQPFDMFPQTTHVECLTIISRDH